MTASSAIAARRGGFLPDELPPDVAAFTGREHELDQLRRLGASSEAGSTVVISAIEGLGGVGKSALAIHAAHALADRFGDGVVYLDLQGSTVGLEPLTPVQALGHLLGSLGVDPAGIPASQEEAAARFRTLAARRRLLLVLDNARDAAQVRPLLPASPSCMVLVTSRDSLAVLEGVRRLSLDVLPEADALVLLGRLAGPRRLGAEPHAAARLAGACGYLPLALEIAGRRLDTRPGWSIDAYADRLAGEQHRLDQLRLGDRQVRGSFEVSYQILRDEDPQAARAFRFLALLDGPDIAVAAAAALLDQPAEHTQTLLDRLADASLLTPLPAGRYRLHDLLRLFAREHATEDDPPEERSAAVTRALRFYLATTCDAFRLLRPGDPRLDFIVDDGANRSTSFPDLVAALDWLEAERANLVAAVEQAASTTSIPRGVAGQLATALYGFFNVRCYWPDWTRIHRAALAAARRDGDRAGEARALNDLCMSHGRHGQDEVAVACGEQALAIHRDTGDRYGQAASLNLLGLVWCEWGGRYDDAQRYLEQALPIRREVGDRYGEGATLSNLGIVCERQGRYQQAVAWLEQALAVRQDLGDRYGQAFSLHNLATVYQRQGRYEQAMDCYQQALAMRHYLGDRHGEAATLKDLGLTLQHLGQHQHAREHWQTALAIFEQLDAPEAHEVRVLLSRGT